MKIMFFGFFEKNQKHMDFHTISVFFEFLKKFLGFTHGLHFFTKKTYGFSKEKFPPKNFLEILQSFIFRKNFPEIFPKIFSKNL